MFAHSENNSKNILLKVSYLSLLSYSPTIEISMDQLHVATSHGLQKLYRKFNISPEALRIKALYLFLLSSAVQYILNSLHNLYPFSSDYTFDERIELVNKWLLTNCPHYRNETVKGLCVGEVDYLCLHSPSMIRSIFETTLRNYYRNCLLNIKKYQKKPEAIFNAMLTIVVSFFDDSICDNFFYNLMFPSLMQLFYQCKQEVQPNLLIIEADNRIRNIAADKLNAAKADSILKIDRLEDIIQAILIFDFPYKPTILDELRGCWQKEREAESVDALATCSLSFSSSL